ncbi:hypothetical protein BDW74DRAFT_141995 [Aspergillus multicolor]|uniref:putative exopolyphosphatase n=1 Tax=Aspergillus multicolor TaxID=41759 RepID=UPI003CCE4BD1
MRFPPPDHNLLQFLRTSLQVHHRFISGSLSRADSPIYVIGNPSADLDSIISALVYSYFANNRVPRDYPRPHVPVINLDNVSAGPELRRLRPEFIKALELSRSDAGESLEGPVLKEYFLTVADFTTQIKGREGDQIQADSVLVDWNALPVRSSGDRSGKGSLPGLPVKFTVLGCIDHHVDEGFLRPIASTQPNLVETTGSCTSLVVTELEKFGLWQKSNAASANEEQLAKLALCPILIDTENLQSKHKVTNFDTVARDFLLSKATTVGASWDVENFYNEIFETKQNSLELLTVDEIFGRDYKEWVEKPSSSTDQTSLQIGICSVVKSIPWIVQKAGNSQTFIDCLKSFASERKLDVVAVMTAFTLNDGQFSRELLVWGLNSSGENAVTAFASNASTELGLETWQSLDGDDDTQNIKDTISTADNGMRLWVQTNLAKTRKQVAPLVRAAAASL